MVEIIALIAFIVGAAAAGIVFVRKMPQAIAGVQISESRPLGWRAGTVRFLEKIKHHPRVEGFSWIEFLQKQLLKARVAVLKIDNKINDLAGKLRQKREKKIQENQIVAESYWRDLKGIVKGKKTLSKSGQKNNASYEAIIIDHVISEPQKNSEGVLAVKKTALPEEVTSQKPAKTSKKRGARKKRTKNENPFSW